MEYEEIKRIVAEKSGLSKPAVNVILDLLEPFLVLIAMRELPERSISSHQRRSSCPSA